MTDARLRSLSLINFDEMPDLTVHIIGMGAVGSRVFEQLMCLGCRNISCYDFDKVEAHNLHNQLWISADIGKKKVHAARSWVQDKYSIDPGDFKELQFIDAMVTREDVSKMTGIVMLCLDSFDGRRDVVNGAVESNGGVLQVIEGRCAPSFHNVRCIDPSSKESVDSFMQSLGSDDEPEAYTQVCGLPISFAPVMIACGTMMVMQAINFLKNGFMDEHDRLTNFISSPMLVLGSDKL